MSSAAADILRNTARLNLEDPHRRGNVVELGPGLEVVVAGDIHGNRAGLAKAIGYADLDRSEGRRLILQEVIHASPDQRTGYDRSIEVLLRVGRLKIAQGEKLIFLLGNHDLGQATGKEVTKEGRGSVRLFEEGLEAAFGDEAPEVLDAVREFCLSLPLAVRCSNGVLITHSLPSPEQMDHIDLEILERTYTPEDMERGGSVYEWTWGRSHTDAQTDALAERMGVEFFILGHRHVESGWELTTSRAVSIATDHDHGCVVHFDTDTPLTGKNISEHVKPLVSLTRAPQDRTRG